MRYIITDEGHFRKDYESVKKQYSVRKKSDAAAPSQTQRTKVFYSTMNSDPLSIPLLTPQNNKTVARNWLSQTSNAPDSRNQKSRNHSFRNQVQKPITALENIRTKRVNPFAEKRCSR